MLNIAGPEYDFAAVVYAIIEECEHRRLSMDDATLESELLEAARQKLATVKTCYDEFGGSAVYWHALEEEVLRVVMPQYVDEALKMNRLERSNFDVFRGGDLAARLGYALGGLAIGGVIIALPFIPIVEDVFAFGLAATGFVYPDLKRYMFEYRHSRALNRLVTTSAAYQENARIQYMSTAAIQESFTPGGGRESHSVDSLDGPSDGTTTGSRSGQAQ